MTQTANQTPKKFLKNELRDIVEETSDNREQESRAWELIRTDTYLWSEMRDELVCLGLKHMLEDIRRRRRKSLKDNPPDSSGDPDPSHMRNRQSRLGVQSRAIKQQRLWDMARINGKPFRLATKEDLVYTEKHLSAIMSGVGEKLDFVHKISNRVPKGEVQDHMTAEEFNRLWKENYGHRNPGDVGF